MQTFSYQCKKSLKYVIRFNISPSPPFCCMLTLMLTLLTGIVTLPGGADTVFTRVAACDTPPRF